MTLCFDLETHLMRRPVEAPKPVCVSWADDSLFEGGCVDKIDAQLSDLRYWISTQRIVNQNISFDMACLLAYDVSLGPEIFRAYREGRIEDTMLNQQLLDIASGQLKFRKASGGYNLGEIARRYGLEADKEDPWRMRYGDLDTLPLEHWPADAIAYSRNDSVVTHAIALKQHALDAEWTRRTGFSILTHGPDRAKKAFGLHLTGIYGLRTNAARVETLRKATVERLASLKAQLLPTGLVRSDGSRDMKKARAKIVAAFRAKGEEIPITKTWQKKFKKKYRLPADQLGKDFDGASTDRDAAILSGDETMVAYSEYVRFSTVLPRVEDLAKGVELPLQPRYDSLMETGRSSASAGKPKKKADMDNPHRRVGCQIQNFPRGAGPRECLEPREGNCFILADYESAELHGLAQVCKNLFGFSKLGELLNEGMDVHTWFASQAMLGCSYEEALTRVKAGEPKAKGARQASKGVVYGVPGLMGDDKLVLTSRKSYGVKLTKEEAGRYKRALLQLLPEWQMYFDWIKSHLEGRETGLLRHPITGFWRGGATASALSNHCFQHLIAQGALDALFECCADAYSDPSSLLWAWRPVAFCHDEIVMEGPIATCDGAARRLGEVMEREMNKWTPDYPTPAEGLATMLWSKKAERVTDAQGRIVPWKP